MDERLEVAFNRRRPLLESVRRELKRLTWLALDGYPHRHVDRVSFRIKDTSSFIRKVEKHVPRYTNPLLQVEDQVAGRVLVFFSHDVDPVAERLGSVFVAAEDAFHAPPKDEQFGYQTHHLVCLIPDQAKPHEWPSEPSMPETFELQVRTLFMHAWAEPQHDLAYKSAVELASDHRRLLAWVAASAWGADRAFDEAWDEIGPRDD